jgi:hypothetical protein
VRPPLRSARGVTWSVKFRDVDGRQLRERLGRESDGWNRQRAERELGKRLERVDRERWRKPTGETPAALVDELLDEYLPSRGRRRSTIIDYTNTPLGHVLPTLGVGVTLATIEARPELLDRYIAAKRRDGLAPKTMSTTCERSPRCSSTRGAAGGCRRTPWNSSSRCTSPTPDTPVLREEEVAAVLNA